VATARILLVDDELPLLHLLEKYLQRLGFEVETDSRPLDASRRFEAAPQRYDLVIADLGLPDLSGDALLTRMLEVQPGLLMLICSGTPFAVEALPPGVRKQVAFLQKPFAPKMLSEAIADLLSRRST